MIMKFFIIITARTYNFDLVFIHLQMFLFIFMCKGVLLYLSTIFDYAHFNDWNF